MTRRVRAGSPRFWFWLCLMTLARPAFAQDVSVTVQGERSGPSSRDASAASSVARRERLSEPGQSAAELLSRMPGVQVARTGSASDLATISTRGASAAQTPVYLAGVRLNDDLSGVADLSLLPLWMLDRVEVFRGSTPVAADPMGMGGAVFFEPRLPRGPSGGGGVLAGSFGERAVWAGAGSGDERSSALVALRHGSADNDYGYVDDRGTRFDASDDRRVRRSNADARSDDVWALGRSEIGSGARVTMLVNALDREQGVTGLSLTPALAARARTRRILAGLSARTPCASDGDACSLELVSSVLSTRYTLSDPDRELDLFTEQLATHADRVHQSALLDLGPSQLVRLRAYASEEASRLSITQAGLPGLDAKRDTSRAGASLELTPDPALTVTGTGALECHTTRAGSSGERCGVFEPTGRVGARYWFSRTTALLGNAGRYARVPTLGELFGTTPVVRGNPDLAPEHGLNADLGVQSGYRGRRLALAVEAFVFGRWARDLIAFRRTSLRVVRPFNVAEARVLGAELTLRADLLRHVESDSNLTLLDPRDTSPDRFLTNDVLPHQSRMTANQWLAVYVEPEREWLGVLSRASAGARLNYRSSRFADEAGLIVIDEQATLDALVTLAFDRKRAVLRLSADNLFDQPNYDLVGYPLPGRSYHAAFEVWY